MTQRRTVVVLPLSAQLLTRPRDGRNITSGQPAASPRLRLSDAVVDIALDSSTPPCVEPSPCSAARRLAAGCRYLVPSPINRLALEWCAPRSLTHPEAWGHVVGVRRRLFDANIAASICVVRQLSRSLRRGHYGACSVSRFASSSKHSPRPWAVFVQLRDPVSDAGLGPLETHAGSFS